MPATIYPTPEACRFVPATLDATSWHEIEPLINELKSRPVNSAADLELWLLDRSELDAACSEAQATLYINMTCDTESEQRRTAYTNFVQTIPPKLKPEAFELDKRFASLSAEFPLPAARYTVLERGVRSDVELFRPANVPIQTELSLLSQKYEQTCGSMTVIFDGKERTLPQMAQYQEVTDRGVRESAWRTVAERRLKDADTINQMYDDMIARRHAMALNANLKNFVEYAFKSMHRFDYTPAHCFKFHEAVETKLVPLLRTLDEKRRRALNVETLRPWDLSVDPKGRPPLRPFKDGRELMSKSVETFRLLDPRLAEMLSSLGDGSNTSGVADGACLDLDSRKGKGPGGYQYMRDRTRRPFIFMNAASQVNDVRILLHEAGHAFHSLLCNDEPLLNYRHSPIEFAEVASMTMELLTMPHVKPAGFYSNDDDAARANRGQLEKSLSSLAWTATIDAFQHWIYANPSHSRREREQQWLALDERFGSRVSWQGLEHIRPLLWQRQLHLFSVPFYYIEYGIAQLGALGLWLMSLERGPRVAIDHYVAALRLGGSKPLPELFAAAGLKFDFGPETLARIVDRVAIELDKMPE